MKSFMPWFCLVAATANATVSSTNVGVEAYRQGKYFKALQGFSTLPKLDAVASYYLAQMNLYGYGQLKNNAKAIRYYTQAGEAGFLPAQEVMALYALIEQKDPALAFYWFKKSADANQLQAQMYVAAAYLFGYGVKKNPDKARQYYIGAAKQGNSIAQFTLAQHFLESRQAASKTLGLLWLSKSVAQHNPEAELLQGKLYAEGKILPKSAEKAMALIDSAIAQGLPSAILQKADMALQIKDYTSAKEGYINAASKGYLPADLALGQLYMDEKTPLFDVNKGYLSILKAAQSNLPEAQLALSQMYKTGKGVAADEALAKEWKEKAEHHAQLSPEVQAANWLSNGKSANFASSGYQLKGIFNQWEAADAQKQNVYNPPPQMAKVTRANLFKPQFVLTTPNQIPIADYYDVLATSLAEEAPSQLNFASIPFDETLVAIKDATASNDEKDKQKVDAMIEKLRLAASLGDSTAEFDLGQIYQYGIGVKPDVHEAIRNYEIAAAQEDLSSMYALGILYLQGQDTLSPDYSKGLDWLKNAAFKGNGYSQFALAQLYEKGLKKQSGEMAIQPDPEQADGMYFLAAANDNGLAQYRLADLLARKQQVDISVSAKLARQALIKSLYYGAVKNGVAEAALPLAFFNAMDSDKAKQSEAFDVAKKEAEAGKPNAALLLGLMYDRGIGVQQSQHDALEWYQKAGSNSVSDFILGTYYSLGMGLAKDNEKGQRLLQQSADADFSYGRLNLAIIEQQQGHPFLPQLEKALASKNITAGLLLADYYLSLASSEEQMKQARDIYQRFAEKGDKDAQLKLAYMHEFGVGGKADPNAALPWYNLAAEQGQPIAQYFLGRLYQLGYLDEKPDYALAKQWYSRAQSSYNPAAVAMGFVYDTVDDNYGQAKTSYTIAAEHHDPVAQYNLGLIYEKGKGQAVDLDKARELYQQAAEQGHPQAMVRLADLSFNARDSKGDPQQALAWYKKAAEKGDRDAYYQLGLLSETGIATPIDYTKALEDYEKSATLGNQQGMLAAARMYQYGVGVVQNNKRAAEYYEMLAGLGNGFAQYQLSGLYNQKVLSETKLGEEKKWLQEALRNGSPQASRALQKLATQGQSQVSYIEPVLFNQTPALASKPVELMYLDAINQWNSGDQIRSKMIFERIRTQFPDYIPAKRAYERMGLG